ncbi:MAG: class I SAM-dependent methyltransferase, partial [Hespellia sp.]|nr:class I SAM-dependent methyltransferase [Hespellia sp.]
DSLNYIAEEEDLEQVFRWVNNYLDPAGVFIFDFNTEYKYREILGNQTIAENRENCSFIWDNYYYEEEKMNEYELSLFIRDEELSKEHGEIFRNYKETHFQRAYTLDTMKRLIVDAGLEYVAAYDAFTREAPTDRSERIYVIAREHGKLEEKNKE